MKSPVRSEKADPTLLIHLQAVNLEHYNYPVAAGKHRRQRFSKTPVNAPWGKGQTSDSLMPYPVFYKIAKEEDGWATESVHF